MEKFIIPGPCCQSCGMPITRKEDFGTEANYVIKVDYCYYCYRKGAFTEPDITKDEMIEKAAKMMAEKKRMPFEKAKETAAALLPNLKRWRGR